MPLLASEDPEEILASSLEFLGGQPVVPTDPATGGELISYGPVKVSVAPKEGKANTLLADHLFSPALYLAERIELGLINLHSKTVVELGAGCALPSLLLASLPSQRAPSFVIVTDYPDEVIMGNVERNVKRNSSLVSADCELQCCGYDWGKDVRPLLDLLPSAHGAPGFDAVILSDLLHFDASHGVLVDSLALLLKKDPSARAYVGAGKYTKPEVCEQFVKIAAQAGITLVEDLEGTEAWVGEMEVSGLTREDLSIRKGMCRFWVGRWAEIDRK